MKKTICLLFVLLFLATSVFFVYAQPEDTTDSSSSSSDVNEDVSDPSQDPSESTSQDSSSSDSTSSSDTSSSEEDEESNPNSSSDNSQIDNNTSQENSETGTSVPFEDTSSQSEQENSSSASKSKIFVNTSAVTVSGDENTFSATTTVSVEKIKSGELYQKAETSFKEISKQFTLYKISAVDNGQEVTPNGKLTATFAIPALYDINRVVVFSVDNNGNIQTVPYSLNRKKANISTSLNSLGMYAVVELNEVVNTEENADNGRFKSEIFVIVCATVLLSLSALATLIFSKLHKTEV